MTSPSAKATPGPWWPVPDQNETVQMLSNDGSRVVMAGDRDEAVPICVVKLRTPANKRDAWKTRCPEREANARLISAAPDLLAALKALTERYVDLAGSGDCGIWNPEEEEQVIAARAALSKAQGEAK